VIGFVTRGRGVSVHRVDCANAASLGQEQATRLIEVEWDGDRTDQVIAAGIEIVALDRAHLLRDVASALGDFHASILSSQSVAGGDRVARMTFQLELSNAGQLVALLNRLKQIDGVYDVHRAIPGGATS
jgi:GTP pyrophosphokinase